MQKDTDRMGSTAVMRALGGAIAASLVLVAACGEQLTAPAPALPDAAVMDRVVAGRQVTVKRRTSIAMPDRTGKVQKGHREKTLVFREDEIRESAATVKGGAHGGQSRKFDADGPPSGMTIPFGSGKAAASTAWRTVDTISRSPLVVIEAEGMGDAPASLIRELRDGRLTTTVQQEYVRGTRAWELIRRESWTVDGGMYDLVEISRKGKAASGSSLVSEPFGLDGAALLGKAATTVSSPRASFLDEFGDDGAGTGIADCDPCLEKRRAHESALRQLVLAELASLACLLVPPPGDVIACAAAAVNIANALEKQITAQIALADCLKEPKPCTPPPPPTCSSGLRLGLRKAEEGAAGGIDQVSRRLADCGDYDGGGTVGGGPGDAPPQVICSYYVLYDPDTGYEYYRELLYCQVA